MSNLRQSHCWSWGMGGGGVEGGEEGVIVPAGFTGPFLLTYW